MQDSGEDSQDFCVTTLLEGNDASFVKTNCPMVCYPNKKMSISQPNAYTIIATHLPLGKAAIVCGDQTISYNGDAIYGALR